MPHRVRLCVFTLAMGLAAAASLPAAPQIGLSDADRASWEDFLGSAKITDAVQFASREAVTSPWKLTLTKGDVTRFGLWKNIDTGIDEGGPDRWRFEIAAYRLDVLLGLDMVPPTVERDFQGRRGSLQLWMDNTESMKKRLAREVPGASSGGTDWEAKGYIERAFDSLIANDDRNVNNILIGSEDRMILIDHSRTFRTAPPFDEKLVYGAASLMRTKDGSPLPFLKLPRAFVAKLRTLDSKSVREAVKKHLNGSEVRALMARRDLILKEIDTLIREKGEAEVLY
jgi:hypothetical protein